MHLQLKSREIALAHNLFPSCQIVLKFCTEHGSITAVLCANFQNYLTYELDVMGERDLSLRRVLDGYSIMEQPPGLPPAAYVGSICMTRGPTARSSVTNAEGSRLHNTHQTNIWVTVNSYWHDNEIPLGTCLHDRTSVWRRHWLSGSPNWSPRSNAERPGFLYASIQSFHNRPSPKPVLIYCQYDHHENI